MSIKKKLKKLLYGSVPGFSGSFPYFHTKVYFPRGSLIFEMACEQGIYEQENIDLLESLWLTDTYYFDIGANIGLMSIPILRRRADCNVVSFEPSPNSLNFLERTARESCFGSRWTICSTALGKEAGEREFQLATMQKSAFEGFRHTGRYELQSCIKVPVTTLDNEWDLMGQPRVSIIKIDVEGSELEVLAGGKACIVANQPCILMEWNKQNIVPYGFTNDDLLTFVSTHNYRIFSTPGLVPVSDKAHLDLFCSVGESFLLAPAERVSRRD